MRYLLLLLIVLGVGCASTRHFEIKQEGGTAKVIPLTEAAKVYCVYDSEGVVDAERTRDNIFAYVLRWSVLSYMTHQDKTPLAKELKEKDRIITEVMNSFGKESKGLVPDQLDAGRVFGSEAMIVRPGDGFPGLPPGETNLFLLLVSSASPEMKWPKEVEEAISKEKLKQGKTKAP